MYTRDTASGTRSVFWKKALKKAQIKAKTNVVDSNGAMKTAVSNDPYSIGYVSVGFIDAGVAPLSLDGIAPTMDAVKSGQYKVARGLFPAMVGTLFQHHYFFDRLFPCLMISALSLAFLVLPYMIRTTQMALENLPTAVMMTGLPWGHPTVFVFKF